MHKSQYWLFMAFTLFASPHAVSAEHSAPGCGRPGKPPAGDQVKVVSWNISELAIDKQVYDRPIRSETEFADLRNYRDCVGGDVYVLQEIASPKALAQIFPPADYDICFSGQKTADEKGLAPDYPRAALTDISPVCYSSASDVSELPGEITNRAYQYVALAVKRASGISVVSIRDVPEIGQKNPVDGHQTRWGLEAVLGRGNQKLRILVIHLKSRCNEGPISPSSTDEHCPALALQLPHLKQWILEAAEQPEPFTVIGDFNRRLDRENPNVLTTDMWDVITGAATSTTNDDISLTHIPAAKQFKCWPKQPPAQRFPIDFFALDERALALADATSYWKWRYQKDIEAETPAKRQPSDHCPIQLNILFN
jgi:endonuclease/exonuclease/phosphatase family metal-dependent hydrolase